MFTQTFCFGQLNYYLKGGGNMSNVFRESIYHPIDTLSTQGSSYSFKLESKSAFGGYLSFETLKRSKDLEYGIGVQFELIRENYFVEDGKIYFDSNSEMKNFIMSNFSVAVAPQVKYNFNNFSVVFSVEIPFFNYTRRKEVSKEGDVKIENNSYKSSRNTLNPTLNLLFPFSKKVSAITNFSLYKTNNILLRLGVNLHLNKKINKHVKI